MTWSLTGIPAFIIKFKYLSVTSIRACSFFFIEYFLNRIKDIDSYFYGLQLTTKSIIHTHQHIGNNLIVLCHPSSIGFLSLFCRVVSRCRWLWLSENKSYTLTHEDNVKVRLLFLKVFVI